MTKRERANARAVLAAFSAAAAIGTFGLSGGISPAAARTIRVSASPGSLTAAVAAATAGDTLRVVAGLYQEYGIEITRPTTLIGEGFPVIDAGERGEIITVRSDSVRIEGLELRNVGTSFMEDRAAVKLVNASGCTIARNRIVNGFFGIYLENSGSCTVSGNEVRGQAERESTSGNGIHLWHCRDITIDGNVVSGHRDGIYFEFVDNSHITRNESRDNLRYGLHFMFSHHDSYVDNTFERNGAGVAVMYSDYVIMTGNRFVRNWGRASYGLLLKDIRDSDVSRNTFRGNTIAIYSEGSNRVTVTRNDFIENGYAVKIMGDSFEHTFSHNNFVGNEFEVTTNSTRSPNTFRSNYWSDYHGYDLDGDGVGDVPHHPVRLFSLLVEREPAAVILMNSLLVKIIDATERVLPAFTPRMLADDRPLIEAVSTDARE